MPLTLTLTLTPPPDNPNSVLVNLRFSESEPVAVAGTEALAALTSLNRANTITLLHEVGGKEGTAGWLRGVCSGARESHSLHAMTPFDLRCLFVSSHAGRRQQAAAHALTAAAV